MGTIIASAAVFLIIVLCIKDIIKTHKSGGACSFCPNKDSCCGCCSNCAGCKETKIRN